MTRVRAGRLLGPVALVLVLAACTAGRGDGDDDGPGPAPTADTQDLEPDGGPPLEPGALGEFFARLAAVQGDETEAEARERLTRSEEVVAACMSEQGFDYVPADWSGPIPGFVAGDRPTGATPDLDPVEYAREHGYGITTRPVRPEPEDGVWEDPNADTVAAMSAAELAAWDLALYGPGQGEAYLAGEEPYDWTRHGCLGTADRELGVDGRAMFDESAWEDLRTGAEQVWAGVTQDPRVRALDARWVDCMADAGHAGLTYVDEAMQRVLTQDEAIWEATLGAYFATVDRSVVHEGSPEHEAAIDAYERARAALTPVEIETAVADETCRAEIDYARTVHEVTVELEAEFYEAHREQLEEWLRAADEFYAEQ